jgi:hypothetical protein
MYLNEVGRVAFFHQFRFFFFTSHFPIPYSMSGVVAMIILLMSLMVFLTYCDHIFFDTVLYDPVIDPYYDGVLWSGHACQMA